MDRDHSNVSSVSSRDQRCRSRPVHEHQHQYSPPLGPRAKFLMVSLWNFRVDSPVVWWWYCTRGLRVQHCPMNRGGLCNQCVFTLWIQCFHGFPKHMGAGVGNHRPGRHLMHPLIFGFSNIERCQSAKEGRKLGALCTFMVSFHGFMVITNQCSLSSCPVTKVLAT